MSNLYDKLNQLEIKLKLISSSDSKNKLSITSRRAYMTEDLLYTFLVYISKEVTDLRNKYSALGDKYDNLNNLLSEVNKIVEGIPIDDIENYEKNKVLENLRTGLTNIESIALPLIVETLKYVDQDANRFINKLLLISSYIKIKPKEPPKELTQDEKEFYYNIKSNFYDELSLSVIKTKLKKLKLGIAEYDFLELDITEKGITEKGITDDLLNYLLEYISSQIFLLRKKYYALHDKFVKLHNLISQVEIIINNILKNITSIDNNLKKALETLRTGLPYIENIAVPLVVETLEYIDQDAHLFINNLLLISSYIKRTPIEAPNQEIKRRDRPRELTQDEKDLKGYFDLDYIKVRERYTKELPAQIDKKLFDITTFISDIEDIMRTKQKEVKVVIGKGLFDYLEHEDRKWNSKKKI
jgi:hypothetical protein